jgi:Na+/glutamate symporter
MVSDQSRAGDMSAAPDLVGRLQTMELRDRLGNLGGFAAAVVAWVLVAIVVTTRDPRVDPDAGLLGAGMIGLALGLTAVPLFWLAGFARHHRVAYRGDWVRAIRRGAWVAVVVAVFVALRLQGAFQLPIALFVLTMVLIAETTLSVER